VNISIKKKGKEWIATRSQVTAEGRGKTKKKAIADLEETERFLRIMKPTGATHYFKRERTRNF